MSVDLIDIQKNIREALRDLPLRTAVWKATEHSLKKREGVVGEVANWEELRTLAHQIRKFTIDHLAQYLQEFERSATANGMKVHWAQDANESVSIVRTILQQHNAKHIVKSKSMTTEEIHLNAMLEKDGYSVVETDLGEYIVQLAGEMPSHITAPALHKSREAIAELLTKKFHEPVPSDPALIASIVRRRLRDLFLSADAGISGVNFAVAETGTLCIVENEGNARFTITLPHVHIAIMGIDKVIPRMADLALFLKLLPRSATGQRMTSYVSLISSPRQTNDPDGPEEIHVIILDNGRSSLLSDSSLRQVLYCIRCGACLNTCPVYRQIGGHAYGWVYQGPIGAMLAPVMLGFNTTPLHPYLSSLCGACAEICPVKIDIHHVLLYERSLVVAQRRTSRIERIILKVWAWLMSGRRRYAFSTRAAQLLSTIFGKDAKVYLPVWGQTRDFPPVAKKTFHQLYRKAKEASGQ